MEENENENPITIDSTEHNHLQLLLCINELKEHAGRSENLLSKVAYYLKEQESNFQSKLEEEIKQHQITKQQLAAAQRKLADTEVLYENLLKRNRKLELVIGISDENGADSSPNGSPTPTQSNGTGGNATVGGSNANSLQRSHRISFKALSWSEKTRKRKSAPPGKNLQDEIRIELKFLQEAAAVKIQSAVRGWLVKMKFRKMLVMNSKRNNIVRELFETEKSYVRNLSIIVKFFFRPLRESAHEKPPILEMRLINNIFSVIDQVLVAHDILMTMMERRLKKWSPYQKFGDIFLKDYMNNFQSVYSTYINNYNRAFTTLNKYLNENKGFAQFVKQAEAKKECEMHDLLSFLIMPIQRIPRYKLLLTDLLKNTWNAHIDYADLKSAVQKITDIASMLNENKREAEMTSVASSSHTPRSKEPQQRTEKEERDREASYRSLKRNTAILEDLSVFLKTASTWSDGDMDNEPARTRSPTPTPSIPVPDFTEAQVDDLVMRMLSATNGIPTGKNVYHLRVYEQTFPGSAMITWLSELYPQMARDALVGIGQMLLDRGVLTTIKTDQKHFRDSKTSLFKFKFFDKKDTTLNTAKQWLGPAIRDPVTIANALAVITVDIIGKFLTQDKKGVNFTRVNESPEFLALCLQTAELQRVELSHLSPKQKLIFFVNTYNALLVHAHATVGPPKSAAAGKALADKCNYIISGHKHTLEDIEHLILGGSSHFKKKSSKLQNMIPSSARDFMVIFALSTGTVDSPPIVPYDIETFDMQIEFIAREFMQTQVEIKPSTNEMYLPYILWARRSDVWKDNKELVNKILSLLKDSQRAELTKMLSEKGKVEFKWKMQTWQPFYVSEQSTSPLNSPQMEPG